MANSRSGLWPAAERTQEIARLSGILRSLLARHDFDAVAALGDTFDRTRGTQQLLTQIRQRQAGTQGMPEATIDEVLDAVVGTLAMAGASFEEEKEATCELALLARGYTQHLILSDQPAREDPEHDLTTLAPAEQHGRGLDAMSRLEQALNRTDAERLAQQQVPEVELNAGRSIARDSRLERSPSPSIELDPNPRGRDRGRDGPGRGR